MGLMCTCVRDNKGTLGGKAQDTSRHLLENVADSERQILKDVAEVTPSVWE